MLFVLSKLLGFLSQPSTLLWLLLVLGLVRARSLRPLIRQQGLRLAWTAAALLLVIGLSPISTWLLWPLEERFPVPAIGARDNGYAGIIVLGGGEDGRNSARRGQLHLNEAGERITTASTLAFRLPDARLIFTGSAATLLHASPEGATAVRGYWTSIGIAQSRIVIEPKSRNTYENAVFTHAMLAPQRGDRFLLVTSAAHMPRAMGAFRHAGFDVTAYPTDYRSNLPDETFHTFSSMPAGLKRFDEAVKEWIGLVAYRLLGRTDDFFPPPRP
ncbi:MAG: YdcF family protein [Hyphomicrobiaceae bacterium]